MQDNVRQQVMSLFRNKVLNAFGIERDLYTLLSDGDVEKAISLMQDHDSEVDEAIREYNPEMHEVMHRPNKYRKGGDYITEKLPRARQRYINEVELFFLLGRGVKWTKEGGSDEAFSLFMSFYEGMRIESLLRKAKRLAGAETESAILFRIMNDTANGGDGYKVIPYVAARSLGYRLRPLIDQYGQMTAMACGYNLNEGGKNVEHWDIMTKDHIFLCKRARLGWDIQTFANTVGKIPGVYFCQPKAWEGCEARIKREEDLDSKVGDQNNYFADPIACATADVVESLSDPNMPGRLIQLAGKNSAFSYVNPPASSESRRDEKYDIAQSILFDTFTPDFSFEKLKGMGSLSGSAIRNAMILGYLKRQNRMETYGEMLDRLRSVMIAILKDKHPDKRSILDALKISFIFNEPFEDSGNEEANKMASLYQAGLVSQETAVSRLSLTDYPEEEVERIRQQMTKE